MSTRKAVVEGRFYPSTKSRIFDQIMEIEQSGRYSEPDISPDKVYGAVLPHAGHIYSGYQTIPFFQLLRRHRIFPDTFVIVHPNHSGFGKPLAIDEALIWSNAIGEVPVDRELAEAMKLPFDSKAHAREHSAEVILPFIQYFLADHAFSIVPLSMMDQGFKSASLVAESINKAVAKTGRKIMLIASCDFSHFLPAEIGAALDQEVLDCILERNTSGVEQAVIKHRISVCGYGPIMSLMEYARSREKKYKIEILARGHSGEVVSSRDVVDYISLMAYK
ncbi:MAG: AmmeMemoRadiSam system protein B [Bacteroidia bacterium]|nr:MAG: AmmeMemoRadiSam system protein B [Bacteroidia bacterium]